MRNVFFYLMFISLFFQTGCRKENGSLLESKPELNLPPADYKMVWSDEFNQPELDNSKWIHRAPGRRREAFNSPRAVYIDTVKNNLVIKTYLQNDSVITGMIATRDKYHAKYGYFECRAKISHIFPGYWTAFWVHSPQFGRTLDPGVSGMEIDVMEFTHGSPYEVNHAVHWNGYGPNLASKSQNTFSANSFLDGYHTYSLEWTPELYRFYIDGRFLWEVSEPISHIEQYMILSAEVSSKAALVDKLKEGNEILFEVDYVRVYQK